MTQPTPQRPDLALNTLDQSEVGKIYTALFEYANGQRRMQQRFIESGQESELLARSIEQTHRLLQAFEFAATYDTTYQLTPIPSEKETRR